MKKQALSQNKKRFLVDFSQILRLSTHTRDPVNEKSIKTSVCLYSQLIMTKQITKLQNHILSIKKKIKINTITKFLIIHEDQTC